MTIWTDVAEFSKAFGVAINLEPGWPADEDVELALRLIAEEVTELRTALEARDLVATSDGIVDTIYVTAGFGLRIGTIPRRLRPVGVLKDHSGVPGWDEFTEWDLPVELAVISDRLTAVAAERDLQRCEVYIRILIGMCLAAGAVLHLPLKSLWREVHANNMSKLVDGTVIRDAGGKILKPEGWQPPDITEVLAAHGWEAAA